MRWFTGCLIIFLAACTDNKKIPSDVIAQPQMEKILWDMIQSDQYVSTYIMTKEDSLPDKNEKAIIFYQKVFDLHGISKEEFSKSYQFYLGRPDLLKVMFDSISARAERSRPEIYRMMNRRNPMELKRDSLLRIDSLRRADSIRRDDSMHSTENIPGANMLLKDTTGNK